MLIYDSRPFIVTLSQSSLLEGSVASVALAFRRASKEQFTETNCANTLASSAAEDVEDGLDDEADTWLSSWAKFPLVEDTLDFGRGEPFWACTTQMYPTGVVKILPQKDGYLAIFMIETEWESKLRAREELLAYAKPVTSPPKVI
jgi:Transferase family